jgi:ubiquinone/menaquinone biosynthesis C-methylase UbiE
MPDADDERMMAFAAQLRKPQGEWAGEVARKMNEANVHLNRYTIDALDLKPGDVVLEVGMGNGYFVPEILSRNPTVRYIGCDYSDEMVSAAMKLNNSAVEAERATFHSAPANALPLPDASVDILFTVNTIYFWEDPGLVLAEFRRVIRRGGRLVIGLRPKRSMERYPFTKFGFEMYSGEELAILVTDAEFNILDVIEKVEPEQEINGDPITVESLIVVSTKPD